MTTDVKISLKKASLIPLLLPHLFDGCTVTTIVLLMFRDVRTVSIHKRNTMAKFGYKNDGELFSHERWMSRNGLFV